MSSEETVRICPTCLHDDMRPDGTRPVTESKFAENVARKKRWKCARCGAGTVHPLDENDPRMRAGKIQFRTVVPKAERYVVTCAQNATDPHPVFETLKSYCHHNNAELLVIPIRYHNPTSHWGAAAKSQDWWKDTIEPYLFGGRKRLHKHLTVMGDISTQLTAARPTQGFETITGAHSAIIGHPKLELQYVATPQQKLPKAMMSSGTCTVRNYIDGKAGKKGEHHHTYGGIVVEKDGDRFHFRQLNALEDGSFVDLDKAYYPNGVVEDAGPASLLVCGDLHHRFMCPKSVDATLTGPDSMLSVLRPEAIAWHDVMDGDSCNPHDIDNPFIGFARQRFDYSDIKQEIMDCARFFDARCKGVKNYIVASNHEDFLARWMNRIDWRHDYENAEFYLETALAMVRAAKITENGYKNIHPFPYWMKQFVEKADITYLDVDESLVINNIEAGFHGHRGPSGTRGTIANYGRIGVKTIIAHNHSPGIRDGVMQVGTLSQLIMGYTSGPSSWLNSNGVVYGNGKRALLNMIDGHWKK